MVYGFDVVYLQEKKTCPNQPQALQGFTAIQRHEGRGMAIVVRSSLSETVSLLILDRWSTSSRELQGIPTVFSLQKPGTEPRRKLQYPFQYGKSDMGVMSKPRAHKPAHTTNPQQNTVIQPPWWNKETQAAWTVDNKSELFRLYEESFVTGQIPEDWSQSQS